MRSISQYETAWRMKNEGVKVDVIARVVGKGRSTVFRWFKDIKTVGGIRKFVAHKRTCKSRRPKTKTSGYTVKLIVKIRKEKGYCGAKIRKELKEIYQIKTSLATIYRILHEEFTHLVVGVKRYKKYQAMVTASAPRQVVEHDTVDLGGYYAFTSIDIFTKEPCVVIKNDLTMESGKQAFIRQKKFYGPVSLHQSDGGSEFQTDFVQAVILSGSRHRYSRPYKKNEQAHIENFNRSFRSECFQEKDYSQYSLEYMQRKADEFCRCYINERWHMGLPDMMTPAQFKQLYQKDPEYAKIELAKVQERQRGKKC